MIFIHVIGQRVAEDERQAALLTFVAFTRFVDHEMREILHRGTPRGTLGTGVHAEALEAEGAQSPVDVVVSLNEVVDHHVVDARAKGTNRADVRHLVTHVVTTHVLNYLHVAVVIPLADFASVKRDEMKGRTRE